MLYFIFYIFLCLYPFFNFYTCLFHISIPKIQIYEQNLILNSNTNYRSKVTFSRLISSITFQQRTMNLLSKNT